MKRTWLDSEGDAGSEGRFTASSAVLEQALFTSPEIGARSSVLDLLWSKLKGDMLRIEPFETAPTGGASPRGARKEEVGRHETRDGFELHAFVS